MRAICKFNELDGDQAVCLVYVDSYELPRVGFPFEKIQSSGIKQGDWFYWEGDDKFVPNAPDPGIVSPEDEEKLKQLFEWHQNQPQETWEEYTGNGL